MSSTTHRRSGAASPVSGGGARAGNSSTAAAAMASSTAAPSSGKQKPKAAVHRADKFWLHAAVFVTLIATAAVGVRYFFSHAPTLESSECDGVSLTMLVTGTLPKWMGGAGDLVGTTTRVWRCAEAYRGDHPEFVLAAFCIVYISLQTFAIPGPIVLSIIAGALYEPLHAQALIAFCATTGASLCFTISYFIGADILYKLAPSMISSFRTKTHNNKDNLWYYLLFLRLTPLLPNWFVNVASPIVGVPLYKFAIATLVGLVPANYFHVQTGSTLASMNSLSLKDNYKTFLVLFTLQFLPLLPTLFKGKLQKLEQKHFEKGATKSTQ